MKRGWTLRHLETPADYGACVALQEAIWGDGFSERVPAAILKVAREVGGVAAGAFDADGRLVGFVFGLTGIRGGAPVHWSDMLAVRPEAAGGGLGTRLKAFQREAVLAVGVREMLWTFDPLRARNAHLNLNKLGAVVREYRPDMYGDSDSPLHRAVGTDRLVASWDLCAERTRVHLAHALEGRGAAAGLEGAMLAGAEPDAEVIPVTTSGAFPAPGRPVERWGGRVRIAVPSDIGRIMESDPPLARAWRAATREAFTRCLERGYEAIALARGPVTSSYVLAPGADGAPEDPGAKP